jgi:hypothetical protein
MTLPLFRSNEPLVCGAEPPAWIGQTIEDLRLCLIRNRYTDLSVASGTSLSSEDAQAIHRLAGNHVPLAIYMNEGFSSSRRECLSLNLPGTYPPLK